MNHERQDQTFTSRSIIYVCDNNGRNLYLLGVNVLVFMCLVHAELQDAHPSAASQVQQRRPVRSGVALGANF